MTKISEKRIFDLIGSIYETAQQTSFEPWMEVFNDMADLVGSGQGGLSAFDTRERAFCALETSFDPAFLDEFFSRFQHITPWQTRTENLKPGERFNRQEFLADPSFRKHEIYHEFYKRFQIFHLEYRVFLEHHGSHAGITFSRPEGKPNFSKAELLAINYILPHMARAFKLQFNLLDARRQNRMISEAFDHIPQGVIVVDRHRKLVFANARGNELLETRDGLGLDRNGKVHTSAVNKYFEKLIDNINDRNAFEADRYGGVVTVVRSAGRPLELLVAPFKHEDVVGIGSESLAIIYVTDPETTTFDVAELLSQIYGLTPTEARIAQLLAEGRPFADACAEMSIAENTGRTHLKRVFSKTATSRQSELIKVILNGPANIRRK